MNILIVEAHPRERAVLEEQARICGYTVTSCATAKDALTVCQDPAYAVVLIAVKLPDMDGVELCRRIRALPGYYGIILMLAGPEESDALQPAFDAGVDDYLCKSFDAEQLRVRLLVVQRQLQHLLKRRQAEVALQESLHQIERAKQEWEATADSLSQVICLIDSQGRILRVNRTIESWKLGDVTQMKGQDAHLLFHPACANNQCRLFRFFQMAWDNIAQGKFVESEFEDPILERPLHIQMRPVSPKIGRLSERAGSFAILVVEDIAKQNELQQILSQQDRLLLGVAGAMNHLLVTSDFETAATNALKTLGLAVNADRVYIFETHLQPTTQERLMSQRFEWDRFSRQAHVNAPEFQNISYRKMGLERWYDLLSTNLSVSSLVRELPQSEQEFLTPQNITSILLVPILLQERFWGYIGFDDCHSERRWREEEEAVLFALAGSIGGALARQHVEEQLRQTSTDLRAVFQALPDEYCRLGTDDSLLDYNQNTALSLSEGTFIGRWASGMLPEAIERQFEAAIAKVRQTKQLVTLEYWLPGPGKNKRYEEIRIFPFLNDQLIVVVRDLTARKLAEEILKQQNEQIEKRLHTRTAELETFTKKLAEEERKRRQAENMLDELYRQGI